ncbi:MAG: SDR family oxidoreductase [Alphaproteobacteria bacterium]|nr:SDR family oxidoreductase [Alphaproteobacteria bacterium]
MADEKTREGLGRTALITGASSGIGAAFARVFASHGFDVVLTARRERRLRELARELEQAFAITTHVVTADLADPAAPEHIFDDLRARGVHVDALVNNAGYGVPGYFDQSTWQRHRDYLQVMTVAPVHLAHLAAPAMVGRGYGRIINLGSLAGLLPPHAGGTLYYPAKAFLIKFSLAHAEELRGTGVQVTALCPGFTRTNFKQASGGTVEAVSFPEFLWMDAEEVAAQGYRAVMDGVPVCVPGWFNRVLAALFKYLPNSLGRWIIRATSRA